MFDLSLRTYPDPILNFRCRKIAQIDGELKDYIYKTQEIMKSNEGVGIAAPQVGIPLRFFWVYDEVFVNPILLYGSETDIQSEGCLSLPNEAYDVERALSVTIAYQDINDLTVSKRTEFRDIKARVAQHEFDHLEGRLINHPNNWFQGKEEQKVRPFSKAEIKNISPWLDRYSKLYI